MSAEEVVNKKITTELQDDIFLPSQMTNEDVPQEISSSTISATQQDDEEHIVLNPNSLEAKEKDLGREQFPSQNPWPSIDICANMQAAVGSMMMIALAPYLKLYEALHENCKDQTFVLAQIETKLTKVEKQLEADKERKIQEKVSEKDIIKTLNDLIEEARQDKRYFLHCFSDTIKLLKSESQKNHTQSENKSTLTEKLDTTLRSSEEQKRVNVTDLRNKKNETASSCVIDQMDSRNLPISNRRTERNLEDAVNNGQMVQTSQHNDGQNQHNGIYPLFLIENIKELKRSDEANKSKDESGKEYKRQKEVIEKSDKKSKNMPNQKKLTYEGTRQFIRNLKPIGQETPNPTQQVQIMKKREDPPQTKNQVREYIKGVELESALESSLKESNRQESLLLLSVYENESSQESMEDSEVPGKKENKLPVNLKDPASPFQTLHEKRMQIEKKKDQEKKQQHLLSAMIEQSNKGRVRKSTNENKSSGLKSSYDHDETKDRRSDKNKLEPFNNQTHLYKLRIERVLRAKDGLILNRSNLMKLLHNVPQLSH
ncbi:DNA ligase 1-like [Ambystoma mexicanum]|uniref:DNA ligase 1-like n=1 Tax=Ambystoma mexicanum TaxID=8296 RepID=UPI0037E8584F